LPGESDIFGNDQQAGYVGRQPLYYCLEASGNYPYVRKQVGVATFDNTLNQIVNPFIYGSSRSTGWEYNSGLLKFRTVNDTNGKSLINLFTKKDIDRIELYIKENDPGATDWPKGQTFYLTEANNWEINWSNDSSNVDGREFDATDTTTAIKDYYSNGITCKNAYPDNIFSVKAIFGQPNLLTSSQQPDKFIGFDGGLCDASDNNGWIDIKFNIILKEPCTVLAEVVSPSGENYAQASRVINGGWTGITNALNYTYLQDYAPYGAVVPPTPSENPALWSEPLYVMPADTSLGVQTAPYQTRAGAPYGISSSGSFGTTQCISGDVNKLGQGCKDNSDCGFDINNSNAIGLCIGMTLNDSSKLGSGWQGARDILQNLFAKSINIWKWDFDDNQYKKSTADSVDNWDIPSSGVGPTVTNILITDQPADGIDDEFVGPSTMISLKFNSNVKKNQLPKNQLPLTGYTVDWGDDTAPSRVMGLKILDRSNSAQPHTLFHLYECNSGNCSYKPTIQITDNWGLTSLDTSYGDQIKINNNN